MPSLVYSDRCMQEPESARLNLLEFGLLKGAWAPPKML